MVIRTVLYIIAVLLLCGVPLTSHAATDEVMGLLDMIELMDLEKCFLATYRCFPNACGALGDLVCHNFPAGFVETVSAPFTTVIPFVGLALQGAAEAANLGSGGSGQQGDANLHFFDAHIFNFPTRTFIRLRYPILRTCSYAPVPFEVNYLSELDSVGWRIGVQDFISFQFLVGMIAQISQACTITSFTDNISALTGIDISIPGLDFFSDICMGTWGVTYPRTGFSNSESEPVASGIAAYRASRVVSRPFLRVILIPKIFDANPKMQLGYPFYGKPLNCFAKGTTPLVWDNLDTKLPRGRGYIWVLWERKCCCKLPAMGCIGW